LAYAPTPIPHLCSALGRNIAVAARQWQWQTANSKRATCLVKSSSHSPIYKKAQGKSNVRGLLAQIGLSSLQTVVELGRGDHHKSGQVKFILPNHGNGPSLLSCSDNGKRSTALVGYVRSFSHGQLAHSSLAQWAFSRWYVLCYFPMWKSPLASPRPSMCSLIGRLLLSPFRYAPRDEPGVAGSSRNSAEQSQPPYLPQRGSSSLTLTLTARAPSSPSLP